MAVIQKLGLRSEPQASGRKGQLIDRAVRLRRPLYQTAYAGLVMSRARI
jgi:hypothetical protein